MTNFRYYLFLFTAALIFSSCSKEEIKTIPVVQQSLHYDFSEMDSFFKKYVIDDKVDYSRVKEDGALIKIVNDLKDFEPYAIYEGPERLAFWINAYNIYTIKLVTDYYPIESILNIENETGVNPFEMKFIEMKAGRKFSLDEIEKRIIIPDYGEPRIHYALVCAAESCPVLISGAYFPERLDEQLNTQAAIFINDKKKNFLYKKEDEMFLSMIYKWYKRDFIKNDQTVMNQILKYINEEDKEYIVANSISKILYLDYSWKLNDYTKK